MKSATSQAERVQNPLEVGACGINIQCYIILTVNNAPIKITGGVFFKLVE